jgi:hypothetical protein
LGYLCCFLFQQSTSGLQSTSVPAGSRWGTSAASFSNRVPLVCRVPLLQQGPVGVPLLLPFPTEYLWAAEYLCCSRVRRGYHCCFSFSLIFRSSSNRASEHRHTPTHTHTHAHAHTHTRTHALTRARTPSHSHANTHTRTTTHTHTRRQELAGQTLFARLATGGRKVKVKNFESNG